MDYLRLFNNESQYDLEKTDFEYPTVSKVKSPRSVKWMEKPHDYSQDYLAFEALESGTFTLLVTSYVDSTYMTSFSYSIDNGATWVDTTIDNTEQTITTPTINAGGKVLWKGIGVATTTMYTNQGSYFSATGNFNVSGNIMSLLYGDNFIGKVSFAPNTTNNFQQLFKDNNKIISCEHLILPATTLTNYCYSSMFYGCTSLTTAPALPATTLTTYCYNGMFNGCTSLTTAPALPATTLENGCYQHMFESCASLTTAPTLPATTLVLSCYNYMFKNCTNLNYIKAMFTTTPSNTYTYTWVTSVSGSGTFVKNNAAQWNVTGTNGVPSGWTVETASE